MFQFTKVDFAACLTFVLLVLLWARSRRKSVVPPPGPPPIPILGNVFDFPAREPWLAITKMAKTFGDVVYLNMMGQSMVFLNSSGGAVDLMDKRGSFYSDRMRYVMSTELCGLDQNTALLGFNDIYRRQRKLMDRALGASAVRTLYQPAITKQIHSFFYSLLNSKDPSDYKSHIRRYIGSLILSTIYGYQPKSEGDKFLTHVEKVMDIISNELFEGAGLWLVDIIPILRHLPNWFPGAGFKRKAAVWKKEINQLTDEPFQYVKKSMSGGSAAPSFCSMLLDSDGAPNSENEEDIKCSAATMFSASIETSISLFDHFILAMVLHPEIQAKAQAEIDAVVGSDRWPTFSDRPNLPFCEAIMSESLRWAVPVPLSIPHRLMQDDMYDGMHLSEGSLVIANLWRMCRDENLYPNSEAFDPERFMRPVDEQTARRQDPRNFVFGFGRRRCPGLHFVEHSGWLLMVSMLATLKISKATNVNGKIIEPEIRYMLGFFRLTEPFKCNVAPRSERALKLIQDYA